ncbi:MAG: response regulator transcription factor [Deltaproteobacteria bacterium]|nr:response regulator transcription factor [Deltaproteobacteria bacterium]
MKKPYRLVIAEDHTILREGLGALIRSDPEIELIAEAKDGREAVQCVERLGPDLVLMDLSMPNMHGLEAIKEIKTRFPGIRVLTLTVHKTEEYVYAALKAGADGYVLKDATHAELSVAIKSVLKGNRYLSPSISSKVIDGYLEGTKSPLAHSAWDDTLSRREREILKLIAEGHKSKEIADMLYISPRTVQKHRYNLMQKLNLRNVAAITAYAIDKGLVER